MGTVGTCGDCERKSQGEIVKKLYLATVEIEMLVAGLDEEDARDNAARYFSDECSDIRPHDFDMREEKYKSRFALPGVWEMNCEPWGSDGRTIQEMYEAMADKPPRKVSI